MSKSKHPYKVYNGKSVREAIRRAKVFSLILPLALGLICGAATVGRLSAAQSETLAALARRITLLHSSGFLRIFGNALCVKGGAWLLTLFLGFSLIGCPLLLLVPFFGGAGLGMISGYFYAAYKLSGIGYCLVILYPSALVAAAALLFSCRESWAYSRNAYEKALRGRGEYEKDETKIFLVRQLFLLIVMTLSAIIEAVFGALFSGLIRL